MSIITLFRYYEDEFSTASIILFNGKFVCYGLENKERKISPGLFKITLRKAGKMHEDYKRKFSWHEGMLELKGVPNRSCIYFHIANYFQELKGCIGVGTNPIHDENLLKMLTHSKVAYKKLYEFVLEAVKKEDCSVIVGDAIDLIKYDFSSN